MLAIVKVGKKKIYYSMIKSFIYISRTAVFLCPNSSNETGDSGGPLFDADGVQIGVVSYGT